MASDTANDTVSIRYANSGDNVLLAELGAQTFFEAFAADNKAEDMAAYLAKTYSPDKQAMELANPSIVTLIAQLQGVAVGYATMRTETTAVGITGARPMELGRIYAVQKWIGRGIGAQLMQACLDEAQRRGHDTLWLSVWERNPKACSFYRKWGFVEVGTQIFMVGDDPQSDILMQRTLTASPG